MRVRGRVVLWAAVICFEYAARAERFLFLQCFAFYRRHSISSAVFPIGRDCALAVLCILFVRGCSCFPFAVIFIYLFLLVNFFGVRASLWFGQH